MNITFLKTAFLLLLANIFTSCQTKYFVASKHPNFDDYKKFHYRNIESGNKEKFTFTNTKYLKTPKNIAPNLRFEKYLQRNGTVAFIIIKNDTVQYEKYFKGYNRTSVVNSFSIAKSITSLLIGCAVDDKLIRSIDELITTYILELCNKGFDKITIKHLLQMTSGIKFNENYYFDKFY